MVTDTDLAALDPAGHLSSVVEIKGADRHVNAPEQIGGLERVNAIARTRFMERAVGGRRIEMGPAVMWAWLSGVEAMSR